MYSLDIQAKIAEWRRKSLEGTITLEELQEAVAAMRGDRFKAASSSESSARRGRVKAAIPDANDMLDELKGL